MPHGVRDALQDDDDMTTTANAGAWAAGADSAGGRAGRVIEMDGVRKAFGALQVLDGLGLSVERGEVFGFLGRRPNSGACTRRCR